MVESDASSSHCTRPLPRVGAMTDKTPTLEKAARAVLKDHDSDLRLGAPDEPFSPYRVRLTVARDLRTALAAEQERREAVRKLMSAADASLAPTYATGAVYDLEAALARCRELDL